MGKRWKAIKQEKNIETSLYNNRKQFEKIS